MSKWYEGVLEIQDIDELDISYGTVRFKMSDYNFAYYDQCLNDYIVFRYMYIYYKEKFYLFKHCFIMTIFREKDHKCSVSFSYDETITDEEKALVTRGIKLNKIKDKIKKSTW